METAFRISQDESPEDYLSSSLWPSSSDKSFRRQLLQNPKIRSTAYSQISSISGSRHFSLRPPEGSLFSSGSLTMGDYYNESDISQASVTMRPDPNGHFRTVRPLCSYFASEWHQSRESDQVTTESMRIVLCDLAVHADITVHRLADVALPIEGRGPIVFHHVVD